MDRCEEDWYNSDNNIRGTLRGSRKKPNAGRKLTGRISTAVLCRGLEKNGMVRAWHGHGMASVNQTRPQCANQMVKTHSKHLAARHGRGTAWARHAMCESVFRVFKYQVCDRIAHGSRAKAQREHSNADNMWEMYTLK